MERITIVDDNRQAGMLSDLNFSPDERHIIIGCGGIGFWLGIMAAMMGVTDFVIMDGDKIDNSNLSRLPVPQTWVGQNKAVALRKMLRTLRPDVRCVVFTTHITVDTLSLLEQFTVNRERAIRGYSYEPNHKVTVWDTTDDARIQTRINQYVETIREKSRTDVTYRKIGYEGFNVGSYQAYEVWTQTDYTTGYRTTSANAVSSALAAGLGFFARYLIRNEDVTINLKELIKQGGTVWHTKTGKSKKDGTQVKTQK